MSKILYIDCVSGISGDMTIGAFLSLGVDLDYLKNELAKLHIHGYRLEAREKSMRGISGIDFDVVLCGHEEHLHGDESGLESANEQSIGHEHGHDHDHDHSTWGQIKSLINESTLNENVKSLAVRIFERVAQAEAKVHGLPVDEVHFHEVGAVDSIIDIVGTAICFDIIKPDKVVVSPMNTGSGTVRCSHGILPVPAPATCEILASCSAKIYSNGIYGELVTPTGAAIAAELANEFGELPSMQIEKTGYGTGKKDFGIPNVLRMIVGSQNESYIDEVMVLEANIDDMSGEIAGFVLEKLFQYGALDVFYTPICMKKNRPALKLSVLCPIEFVKKLEKIILAETTTIGIRKYKVQRTIMKRKTACVKLPYGEACIKLCEYEDIKKATPEYESVRLLAQKTGLPMLTIYNDILFFHHTSLSSD